jgi:ribonuclease HI
MNWIPVAFKGKTVYAQAGPDGALLSEGGRTPIRYSKSDGAKVYRAGTTGLGKPKGKAVELDAGTAAEPSTGGSGGARKKKGSGFGKAGTRTQAQSTAAKQDAAQRIAALPAETHIAFTDGACKGNPGPCGAGAVLKLADGTLSEAKKYLGRGTNNVGELSGIGLALDLLDAAGIAADAPVVVFTDSQYSFGVLAKNWKAKVNTELILGLRARLKARPGARLDWVAGHVGIPENERADRLAGMAVEQR